jgi:hypothetical protein
LPREVAADMSILNFDSHLKKKPMPFTDALTWLKQFEREEDPDEEVEDLLVFWWDREGNCVATGKVSGWPEVYLQETQDFGRTHFFGDEAKELLKCGKAA